jgi:hypothetical protein
MEDAAKDREKSKEEKNVQPKKLNTFLWFWANIKLNWLQQ